MGVVRIRFVGGVRREGPAVARRTRGLEAPTSEIGLYRTVKLFRALEMRLVGHAARAAGPLAGQMETREEARVRAILDRARAECGRVDGWPERVMVMELAVEEVFGARQVERLRHEYRSRPVPADPEHREKFVRVMAERFE